MIECRHSSVLAPTVAVVLAIIVGILMNVPAAAAAVRTFYVAPSGSGTVCSLNAPCSLTAARDLVRTLNASITDDIVVDLRGGTYRLDRTFALGLRDSGMNGHRVVWQAYPGEKPTLSGAIKVTGWHLYDAGKKIYRARVPADTVSRQLFVNGVRAFRDRKVPDPSEVFPGGPKTNTLPNPIIASNSTRYLSWHDTDPNNPIELIGYGAHKQVRCPVASITASGRGSAFTLASPCYSDNGLAPKTYKRQPWDGGDPGFMYVQWIENAYELLGTPGQLYLDPAAAYLYYVPRSGENMVTADVELPTIQTLVSVSGTPGLVSDGKAVPPGTPSDDMVPVDDSDPSIAYSGSSWAVSANRHCDAAIDCGDFGNSMHYTTHDGDSATITFTGTGIDVLSEQADDEGNVDVYLDGIFVQTVTGYAPAGDLRPMRVLYSRVDLSPGTHQVKLVKHSGAGTIMVLDAYVPVTAPIAPVHDITISGITFTYTTWMGPNGPYGYWADQSGLLWTDNPQVLRRAAAALQVERGQRIQIIGDRFTHLGGAGIDLGDGTQDSSVIGNVVSDTSANGINLGEFTDFWLTDPARQSAGDTVSDDVVSYTGQDYQDSVGILVGITKNTVVSHNDVSHVPYMGISMGTGYQAMTPCAMATQADSPAGGANRQWTYWKPWGTGCRNLPTYAGGNQITDNYVHDVMEPGGATSDGGAIYVLGGQGSSSNYSTISGNMVKGAHGHGLYVDIGSSYWHVTKNVVSNVSQDWVNMWVESIHDIDVDGNFTDDIDPSSGKPKCENNGYRIPAANIALDYNDKQVVNCWTNRTNDGSTPTTTVTNTTLVTNNPWPDAATIIMQNAGVSH